MEALRLNETLPYRIECFLLLWFYTNSILLNMISKLYLFYHEVYFRNLEPVSQEKNDKSKSSK